jgi:hypothetical protein
MMTTELTCRRLTRMLLWSVVAGGALLAGCKTNPPAPPKPRTDTVRKTPAPAPAPHGPDYDGVLR